ITNSSGTCKGIFMAVTSGNKVITLNADGSSTLSVPGGSSNTEPATVNAALGGNYTLTYHQSQAGGIYTDGQQVNFSVNAGTGVLSVGGIPLGNPVYIKYSGVPNTAEVIWKDGNIEYALSNNTTGVFNEINISDKSKAVPFMGQFRLPAVAQTCTSPTSGDNIIKFDKAPADFCGFTRANSLFITSGTTATYTFVSGDADLRYVVVNLENNVVKSMYVENSKYGFGCGSGTQIACTGINFIDGANQKEFIFSNTVLNATPGSAASGNLTLVSGSVIHPVSAGTNVLRTENGVEFYDCAAWTKIPNGGATSNVSISFINQRGNFKAASIYGLSSINRTQLLFGGLQNGGTKTLAGLHNQMVMVDDNAGTCLAVIKAVTAGDKNVTLNADNTVTVTSAGGDMTKTCVGNTNPRGCLTITGAGALESAFEHIGSPLVFGGGPQVQLNGTPPTSGAITFFGAGVNANSTNDGVSVGFQKSFGSTDNATYTFQKYDGSANLVSNYGYECVKDAGNDCPGLSVDTTNRRIAFDGVVMAQKDNLNGGASTGKTATFNGTLNY
ncbi:MAG TPA: hypothetical protein VFW49_09925, partial [Fluviicoccus sp.]|nr:hypothetical protein [Fluviicoccus sp.]